MRNRRTALTAAGALLLVALAANPPSADIRILTHEASDPAPHRLRAAVDIGLFAVSVLVTWTNRRLHGGF